MLAKRSSQQSVAQKVFVRSTKAGNAVKVYREQYLRKDVPCGSQLCSQCVFDTVPDAHGNTLSPVLRNEPKEGPHYVILDTNIVLKAMDLLEHPDALFDVIVPQVVLDEVRNRSLPLYTRLRALTTASMTGGDKRFYVFHNEFRKETYISREPRETVNDYNDRAIRKVAQWYQAHLKDQVPILLLSNDRKNREQAAKDGINAASIQQYVKKFHPDLIDVLPDGAQEDDQELEGRPRPGAAQKESIYEQHLSTSKVLGGLQQGSLCKGKLQISRYNYLEASVYTGDHPKPVLIIGREHLNRAFDGDQVAIQILPEAEWQRPLAEIADETVLDADEDKEEGVESRDERKLLNADNIHDSKATPTAKVVAIIKRNWRFYVGQIVPESIGTAPDTGALRSVLFRPLDKRVPRIRIRTRRPQALKDQRIVVAVDDWPEWSRSPEGHFIRELGAIESHQAETEAILLEHDIEYRPFPPAALACLPSEGSEWRPKHGEPGRRDLRDLLICSIDPPRCQDIDDALHAHLLPNGNYHVGVHIADVTHFVKADTPLDIEGASRATSTYLVDRRIDMLPALLGTDLCSLRPDVERYAFSVIWEMTPNAEIVSVEYTKSVIKSRRAFEYEEAQAWIDGKDNQDDLTKGMRILLDLSRKLRQKRLDDGALNLASPEVKVLTDSETSDPSSVEVKKAVPTNSLVEEFMLLANISVARKIYDAYPQTAMLRRHAAPPATNFEELNDQLRRRGMPVIDLDSSKALADSLDTIVDPEDPFFNTLVRIMATRCMMAAEYFVAGNYAPPEFRHYGLASDIYTHFTSPIRRYADVVVHRQLAGAIEYADLPESHYLKNRLDSITDNINSRHRNAQLAGRASIEYYVGQMLKEKDSVQEGHVVKVFANGIGILVPKFGLESIIHLSDICDKPAEQAHLDEDTYTLTVDTHKGRRVVTVFDKVKVFVHSVKDEKTGKRSVKMLLE